MTDIITIDWLNEEKRVLVATYHRDGWTWEDLYEVFKKQKAMIATVDGIVDVIVDVRNSSWLPKGGSLTSGIRKLTGEQHPRQGHTIIMGAKGMVAVILNSVMKLVGKYRAAFHFTKTMDESLEIIRELQAYRKKTATESGASGS
ncbi:MAG TPA: hypothetical protein VHL11_02990 [Phototrophicaceae bacterium]|jgi:hypothetical protein|nr:hypothetical protein [Phototrophicaceae bacterium]